MKLLLVLILGVSVSLFVFSRTPAAADVSELLGQNVTSSVEMAFEQRMGCTVGGFNVTHIMCLNKGVELVLDNGLRVNTVWLYAGVGGYSAFRGQIPLGLEWGMTRQRIEAILGPPQRVLQAPGVYLPRASLNVPAILTLQYAFEGRPFKMVDLDFTVGDGTPATQQLYKMDLTRNAFCTHRVAGIFVC